MHSNKILSNATSTYGHVESEAESCLSASERMVGCSEPQSRLRASRDDTLPVKTRRRRAQSAVQTNSTTIEALEGAPTDIPAPGKTRRRRKAAQVEEGMYCDEAVMLRCSRTTSRK